MKSWLKGDGQRPQTYGRAAGVERMKFDAWTALKGKSGDERKAQHQNQTDRRGPANFLRLAVPFDGLFSQRLNGLRVHDTSRLV